MLKNRERIDALAGSLAAAQDRRRSLTMAGAAALLAVGAAPRLAGAKGKAGKTAKKRCKRQVSQCNAAFDELCGGSMNPDCRDLVAECCQFLGNCNAGGAMECIVDLLTTKA